ncbi:hypothetical protein OLR83_09450 [Campylobacter jejuni]|nr:hypothetical protein [Campylobacter jejuni]
MEEFYPYTLTIHLLCAILFIGYLFVDVFVLGVVKKKNPNFDKSLFSATGVKIMPFVVLLLFFKRRCFGRFSFQTFKFTFCCKNYFGFWNFIFSCFFFILSFYIKEEKPAWCFYPPFCICALYRDSNTG